MSKALNGIVLTLAGIGLLTGPGAAGAAPERLHADLRARVLDDLGDPADHPPEAIRTALKNDPDFAPVVAHHTRKALDGVRRHPSGEDALQETLLKIWKGRPGIFLKPHDEVVRYLRASTGRNLCTNIQRAGRTGAATPERQALAEAAATDHDPTSDPITDDLLTALRTRLDPVAREVLRVRIDGHQTERTIATVTGLTRYSIARATDRIHAELADLLVS